MEYDKTNLAATGVRAGLNGVLSLVMLFFTALLTLVVFLTDSVYEWSGLKIFALTLFPFVFALLFSLSAYIRSRLFKAAIREEQEKILLEKRKAQLNSILDVSEDVRFTAQRSLSNFDRFVPGSLAVASFLLGLFLLYTLVQPQSGVPEAMQETGGEIVREWLQTGVPENALNLALLSLIISALSFFSGIFLVGQSHEREYRWLRPVGSLLIFGGVTMFLSAICAFCHVYGKTALEYWCVRIIFAMECIITAEFLLDFVIEFYRPRTQETVRPVYESRVLAIFTEPGGVVRNMAEALDYQFGFKVSGTSVYLFARKIFVPAVMIWGVLLWLFTCFAEVGPGELGVRERFGKAIGADLEPGLHAKLPWPFERIIRVPVDALQSVTVGAHKDEDADSSVILWTGLHYAKEDPFMVASKDDPETTMILETSLPIFYRPKRGAIREYVYNFDNLQESLQTIGKAEATAYFASADFYAVISDGREQVCRDLQARIQKQCDNLGMGIEIASVTMMDAHPPMGGYNDGDDKSKMNTNVAEAFQLEVIASEEAKTEIFRAEAQAAKIEAEGRIEELKVKSEAKIYKNRVEKLAEGEKALFEAQLKAYNASEGIFRLRLWLDFLTEDCAAHRKYVVSRSLLSRIYEFNFEEKAKIDLLGEPDMSQLGVPEKQ